MTRKSFGEVLTGALTFAWLKPIGVNRLFGRRYTVPPTLWYENADGQKWIPSDEHFLKLTPPPEGYIYQRSQFPCELHESCCSVPSEANHFSGGQIFSGVSSYPEDLVFAMAHDGYKLSEAILIASNMCERCLNAAASDYRLTWGYARHSSGWNRANTQCQFCKVT